ncbi:hypothetical protein O181_079519 [Austropuccinia psidii MF-1]|uniref:Integrase catalytic domain-containing protein n=1 Tax=Austropuccinia psidii MF-1 TaxID=1389203 RepID=A0A9Q3FIN1_9BASI|nr:hypothetical protein [Austropuccinia psidii MF-1]
MLERFRKRISITRNKNKFVLETHNEILMSGKINNNLMYVDYKLPTCLLSKTIQQDTLWNHRLGHPSSKILKLLNLPTKESNCIICEINKSKKKTFNKHFENTELPFDCIHVDLVGPIKLCSNSGFQYFLTIVDQFSSYKIIKFLKRKSDCFQNFVLAKKHMENKQDRKIKKLISDKGGKFQNNNFKKLSEEEGFTHFFAPTETPEHNGYAERANRTILEKARCLLNSSNLPRSYWAEAINTATFISNLLPTPSRNNQSPHTIWMKKTPNLQNLKVFGCRATIHCLNKEKNWKLDQTGQPGILIGYENEGSAYRILRIKDNKVIITRHASFNENCFPELNEEITQTPYTIWPNKENSSETTNNIESISTIENPGHRNNETNEENIIREDENITPERENTPEEEFRTISRIKVVGPRHPTIINSNVDKLNILPYQRRIKAYITQQEETPKTYKKALSSIHKEEWTTAINKELSNMNKIQDATAFKHEISSEFDTKDIGIADLILGIKINHHEDGVSLDQHHFIEAFLELYGMSQCKTVTTPTATRPDLSFAVSTLSQYLKKPGIKHWSAFLHVLKYLKGSQELGLLYKRGKQNGIEAYSDADWGNCRATRRSVTGYLAKFNDCTVLWKSRKQPTVLISTAEAEYKALCDLMSELLWLKQWCEEAKILKTSKPIITWEDNQSCINIANKDCNFNNKRLKHIDIRLHFIKEIVKAKTIILNYKPTKEMLANFLTKSNNKSELTHSLELLGLRQLGERGSVKQ